MHFAVKVESQCKRDCCWVDGNLATLTYWGYNQILNTGVSLGLSRVDLPLSGVGKSINGNLAYH